jgi:hypothetical protein
MVSPITYQPSTFGVDELKGPNDEEHRHELYR